MAAGDRSSKLREYKRKRDFARTAEPAGAVSKRRAGLLHFVVQKHAASHLHFDLRLELDGVMKSWAVPKGPSLDPSVKRLAVEVEDHPMAYNSFEGTIPAGEYGGGTVMIWDRGTYGPADVKDEDPQKVLRTAYKKGRIDVVFAGERLQGGYTLVRTRSESDKPQWLFFKRNDDHADTERDLVAETPTSIESGRTMEEIAEGVGVSRVWHSNRKAKAGSAAAAAKPAKRPRFESFSPMLCETGKSLPEGKDWVFEPKLDGIRVIAIGTPTAASLVTRNGNEKATQFPEIVEALKRLSQDLEKPVVLDGEIVVLGPKGEYLRFEAMQGRMHLTDTSAVRGYLKTLPAALVAFDILLESEDILTGEPWKKRRARLEDVLDDRTGPALRLGEVSKNGKAIIDRAEKEGWEGVIAKRATSPYRPGARSRDWIKLKLEHRQEFVIGGWTEPRNARKHLGALLLGYYDESGKLVYAGHTGTGFTDKALEDVYSRLVKSERKSSPFTTTPKTNEKAHWVTPRLVAEVRFNEWTSDGKLRQPVYLGIRDDKDPKTVGREPRSVQPREEEKEPAPRAKKNSAKRQRSKSGLGEGVARQVEKISQDRGSGKLELDNGRIEVTNLNKVFFPNEGYTKGELLAYYARMADFILPHMKDRPLVLKRFPNGINSQAFYQQAAPDSPPPGVRVETLPPDSDGEPQRRFIGGSLATLLYTIQLGAISYDPWHSRFPHLDTADYSILDLDPGEGATFGQVIDVARWVKEEMEALGLVGALKTSGSKGLHIYLPLEDDTPLEAATLIAQIVATRVAQKHPDHATVERMVRNRPRATVYVDFLQNILGKTVAGVYSVRAKPGATVSTPLSWDELTDDLDLRDFTLRTVPERVRKTGDLWDEAMSQPNSLSRLLARTGAKSVRKTAGRQKELRANAR